MHIKCHARHTNNLKASGWSLEMEINKCHTTTLVVAAPPPKILKDYQSLRYTRAERCGQVSKCRSALSVAPSAVADQESDGSPVQHWELVTGFLSLELDAMELSFDD
jgi:hypothetical protein